MTRLFEDEELGRAVAGVETPRARDEFRADLRRALIATAASEWTSRSARRPLLLLAPRFAFATAVLAVAAVGASASAAASLPGDNTYGLKLAYEQVELSLASDDATKVEVLARQSDRRLDELKVVETVRPDQAPTATEAYRETLTKFQAALAALKATPSDAKDDAAVDVAAAAAQKHVEILESIQARNDAPGIEKALEQAKQFEREANDKKERRDDEERGKGSDESARPSASPTPVRTATPRPSATPRSPRPSATPHEDGADGGD